MLRPAQRASEQPQAQASEARQNRIGGQLPRRRRRRLPFMRVAALAGEKILSVSITEPGSSAVTLFEKSKS